MPRQAQQEAVEEEDREQGRGSGGRGINQVTLVGRLARDPDVRTTEGGVARAWFVLAVARPFVARDGDRDADFISVVAWRQLAGVVGEHLSKGRLIGVTGRLQVNLLDDGNGGRRSSAEVVADQIVFLDSPRRDRNEESDRTGEE
jgi:single-strand DNA-binding protein